MKSVFLQTLILNSLTSLILKPALILAKTLTSDPYNGGLLKRRRSVSEGHSLTLQQLLEKSIV